MKHFLSKVEYGLELSKKEFEQYKSNKNIIDKELMSIGKNLHLKKNVIFITLPSNLAPQKLKQIQEILESEVG